MKFLTILIIILLAVTASATIINIPDDYATIQAGIDSSTDGDTVLVQPGMYVENINFGGRNITVGSMYLSTEDTSHIESTIINCDSNYAAVFFENGEDSTAIITGFTIRSTESIWAAGIRCEGAGPTIRNNYIRDNLSRYPGAGIYCIDSHPRIIDNMIMDNTSFGNGGAIACRNSDVVVAGNLISSNLAGTNFSGSGGGIHMHQSNANINHNIIVDNRAHGNGGGIYFSESNGLISYNEIYQDSGYLGGGIHLEDYSNPTVTENNIYSNIATEGGAIHLYYECDPIISDNYIHDNIVRLHAAGISCWWYCNPEIASNMISANRCLSLNYPGRGGAIHLFCCNPVIESNVIIHNEAAYGGGIVCDNNSNPTICGNVLAYNSATDMGGCYHVDLASHPYSVNNIIHGNSAGLSGGGAYCYYYSGLIARNDIFWDNSAPSAPELGYSYSSEIIVTFSDINGGWPGEGNIDIDPLFRDPDNGDFRLMAIECGDPYDSPCIDMGYPGILDTILNCDWGLGSERSDMGAYSGGELAVDINESIVAVPKTTLLAKNYPNPFNAATSIKYELPRQAHVTIEIYDILGRKVASLVDRQQLAGYHQAVWQADGFSSGMYFYKLQAGDYSETKKMLLLK
ncbi:MAG: T9SS type A sorting domain-containing protein [candidate division Zixibacteria bacterium]|nr:T9SS type A sorting domain-containing protein [candidate division Zixibacteria bacterium]